MLEIFLMILEIIFHMKKQGELVLNDKEKKGSLTSRQKNILLKIT